MNLLEAIVGYDDLDYADTPEAKMEILQFRENARVNQMIGMARAFEGMAKLTNVSNLQILRSIKENKEYIGLHYIDVNGNSRCVSTWAEFCEVYGKSVKTIDEQLRNLKELGDDFLNSAQQLGLSVQDLRGLRRIPEAERQQIIEVVQKPDASRDQIMEMIEQVMAKHAAEKEQAVAEKAELESQVQDLQETAAAKDRVIQERGKKVDELAEKLAKKQVKEPKPQDVASELTMRLSTAVIGVRSDISRLRDLFEQLVAHGAAHGFDHRAQMVGSINQVIRDAEMLRELFALPEEAPTDEVPEWLKDYVPEQGNGD